MGEFSRKNFWICDVYENWVILDCHKNRHDDLITNLCTWHPCGNNHRILIFPSLEHNNYRRRIQLSTNQNY